MDQPSDPAAAIETMRALLAEHDRQERRVANAYADGYRDGHDAGWHIGYGRAHHEMAANWRTLAQRIRAAAGVRTVAERAALDAAAVRGDPCQNRCGRCSRCIRADAVRSRGGDYPGRQRSRRGAA